MRITRPSRRQFAPLVGVAVVLAVALPVGLLLNQDSPSALSRAGLGGGDPGLAAIQAAADIIRTAPVPVGANAVDGPPLKALDVPLSVPGAQHVRRTRFWTAPGTVSGAIAYLTAHPPHGMHGSGSEGAGGPGVPDTQGLDFAADDFRSLQYAVVTYRGGVAIRADAVVLWAPQRSPADMVPEPVTSVDVVVVRKNPQLHQGAPTIRRTVAGDTARRLAGYFDRLPRAIPTAYVSCPADLGGVQWFDRLQFHGAGPGAQVVVQLVGCGGTTFQVQGRAPIELSRTFPGADHGSNAVIMKALGLAANYGR